MHPRIQELSNILEIEKSRNESHTKISEFTVFDLNGDAILSILIFTKCSKSFIRLSLNIWDVKEYSHFIPAFILYIYDCEPRHEKNGLLGSRPGPTQTDLYSH